MRHAGHRVVWGLGNIVAHSAAADAVRLIQKEFSITKRRLGVLVDGDNDRLDGSAILRAWLNAGPRPAL
jgi:hypothetical protein